MNITISTLVFCLSAGALIAADAKNPGYKDTPVIPGTKWHVHDSDRPHPPIVKPAEKFSNGAPPPADAIVLFNGKDFSKWKSGKGGEVTWKIENGKFAVDHLGSHSPDDESTAAQLWSTVYLAVKPPAR